MPVDSVHEYHLSIGTDLHRAFITSYLLMNMLTGKLNGAIPRNILHTRFV